MYRNKFRNKDTGQEELLLVRHKTGSEEAELSRDLLWTKPVDSSIYEECDIENDKMPFTMFGVECEKGWYKLIQPIVDWVDNYNSKLNNDEYPIYFTQIKEKYGTLRIYVSHGTDELFKMIDDAEAKSATVCEECGSTEDVGQTLGYVRTLCKDCAVKEAKNTYGCVEWEKDGKYYFVSSDGSIELDKEMEEEELP